MSNDASIAVESPPTVEGPPKPKQQRKKQPANAVKPKQQPPYAVVLFNDEEHTFQYVIETLTKVFG
jgi:ATP-dependent Clp protease adapter protein ClpS